MPTIALALPEPVECGMECCLSIGECCCVVRPEPESDAERRDEPPAFTRSLREEHCSSKCAALSGAPHLDTQGLHRPPSIGWVDEEAPLPIEISLSRSLSSPTSDPSSPRAPPRASC